MNKKPLQGGDSRDWNEKLVRKHVYKTSTLRAAERAWPGTNVEPITYPRFGPINYSYKDPETREQEGKESK